MNTEAAIMQFINRRKESDQLRQVLSHLFFRGSITDQVARDEYGITRLAAVIWKLRHMYGFRINSETKYKPNRWGRPISYGVYTLA